MPIINPLKAEPPTHWCVSSGRFSGAGFEADGTPRTVVTMTVTGWPSLEAMIAQTGAPAAIREYTVQIPVPAQFMALLEQKIKDTDADFAEGVIV